ncbi:MAG TPA: acyl-ACP--UDP-N-acetylglucosamine O-acyltransferase [Terriglobales bacterium]|nr:acyl-ACP--UDP-N-acetylglucosamine O-acyltransferase [Terriglobales bacterium]
MISPLASVDPGASIPDSCFIGPGCVIGADVAMGEDCRLDSHVAVQGPTRIGARNHFFPFNSIGFGPQDISYRGDPTRLEIGDDNVVREFCTLHRGTVKGGGVTRIGSHNLIMAYCHIAHDCQVGSHIIMANCSTLGGHVEVGDHASLGAFSPIHQFVRVGPYAYLGGGTITTQDVMPFAITSEKRENHAYGPNKIGLRRKGFSPERIAALEQAFRLLLNAGLNTTQAVERIRAEVLNDDTQLLVDFLTASSRGVIK